MWQQSENAMTLRTPIGVRSMHRQTQTEDSPITGSFGKGWKILMHVDISILYDLKRHLRL